MMVKRRKPKPIPGKPRWGFGWYEAYRTLNTAVYVGVAFGVKFITEQNILWLWKEPGWAAVIGMATATLLKALVQKTQDNSQRAI